MTSTTNDAAGQAGTSVTDTLQSLIVAFVLAMTFRGFFVEGFVIPTGSMALTLMGQHLRYRSSETAYEFPIDAGPVVDSARAAAAGIAPPRMWRIFDPMLGFNGPIATATNAELLPEARMGDRVLVLKFLYPFSEPSRWDVVVFKNPTDPVGDTQNYIKRLVGLPDERLLLADGDVFAAPLGTPTADLEIQRKPEYIQRAVWQPVYDSDFIPVNTPKLEQEWRAAYPGPPWQGAGWSVRDDRTWRCERSAESMLEWNWQALPIDDRVAYNMFRPIQPFYPVSDVRIAAAIEADDPSNFSTSLDLVARSHRFTFEVDGSGTTTLSIRHAESEPTSVPIRSETTEVDLPTSGVFDLEFWHVDQAMIVFIDGDEVARLEYEWGPIERLEAALFGRTLAQYERDPITAIPSPPQLRWRFEGSPLSMRRVRLDRDLYYRPMRMQPGERPGPNGEPLPEFGFGCDPRSPAELSADQFLMLGDNSAASRDSRVWGYPHPLAALRTGEPDPFVVPRSLLLGKAWCVYFPAPVPYKPAGPAVVPDFGRLRFIR
jgi:signal peptidase I